MTTTINNLTNIDFDSLKASLKNYLKAQSAFADYNFEGSNMGVLLDLLAYNTLHNQFFINMAISEMFLDTAQLRDSILSHAKELGYLPRSAISSTAYIDIKINPGNSPNFITIPKGTSFASRLDNQSFEFTTNETITIFPSNGVYISANTPVYEGTWETESFVVNAAATDSKYSLSNENIDINSLEVLVYQNSASDLYDEFLRQDTLLGLDDKSNAYFLSTDEKGKYQILFGDGITGKALVDNNYIRVTYRVCNGELPNGCSVFTPLSSIDGYSSIEVTTVAAASGGAEIEDIESIRFYAPRHYQTRYRAVSTSDYETLIKTKFPDVEAISVYGGETVDPPQFGKVLISVDIGGGQGIPDIKKAAIEDYISTRAAVSVRPVVIDPEFVYVEILSSVNFQPSKTSLSSNDLKSKILTNLTAFRNTYLNDFNISLNASKLSSTIDASDPAIDGNDLKMRAAIYVVPTLNSAFSKTLYFQNELQRDFLNVANFKYYRPAIESSQFTYNGRSAEIEDDGNGILQIVTKTNSERTVLLNNVGSVDYTTGKVVITGLNVSSYLGEAIKIYARLAKNEIVVSGNKILDLSLADVSLSMVAT